MQNQSIKAGVVTPIRRQRRQRAVRGTGSVYESGGRWIATLPLEGQAPRKFYGHTSEEAIAKRKAWVEEVAQGLRDSSGQTAVLDGRKIVTVGDWLDHWLDHKVKPVYDAKGTRLKGNQPTTWQNYSWHVKANIHPYRLASIKLPDLRTADVERWYDQLLEHGVAASSAYEARRVLVTALNVALERRQETRLTHNAASAFKLRAPKAAEKAPPDPAIISRLFEVAQGERLELVIHLGLFLGLRRQEIAALKYADFDFDKGELLIRRRSGRIRGQGIVVRGGAKMHDETVVQRVPLDAEQWRPLLQAHRQRVLETFAHFRSSWTGLDPRDEWAFLFVTEQKGEPLDPNLIYRFVKRVVTSAGCPDKTLHSLRHDFAGMLFDSGVPLLAISKAMRHANIQVTAGIYTHMTEEAHRSVVGKAAEWVAQARSVAADGTTGQAGSRPVRNQGAPFGEFGARSPHTPGGREDPRGYVRIQGRFTGLWNCLTASPRRKFRGSAFSEVARKWLAWSRRPRHRGLPCGAHHGAQVEGRGRVPQDAQRHPGLLQNREIRRRRAPAEEGGRHLRLHRTAFHRSEHRNYAQPPSD